MFLFRKQKRQNKHIVEGPPPEQQEENNKHGIAKGVAVPLEKLRYDEAMCIADIWLTGEYGQTRERKIDILDYLIEVLLVELCSCGAVDPLINSQSEQYQNGYRWPFPMEFRISSGEWIKIFGDKKTEVDLATTKIYVHPWNNGRTVKNLFLLKDTEFVYDKNNHDTYYFTDLNFCYVYNGNHSINMGRYMKKGKIMSSVCDMEILYSRIRTDGKQWYYIDTGEVIRSYVDDWRLAAAFTFGQMRYEIRNGL